MKPFILIACLLPAAAVYSQQGIKPPSVSMELRQKLKEQGRPYELSAAPYMAPFGGNGSSVDTGKLENYQQLLNLQRLKKGGLVQATYSHSTARGKVYNLSPDNMPCLVPDTKMVAKMPNGFNGVIPDLKMNAIPKVQIIPLEEKKEKTPEK
jgi:hypothetical protein